jgi:hypothetical protein
VSRRRSTRVSQTIRFGPFRFRISFGRGGTYVSGSVPDGIGRLGVSTRVGRRNRRRSR